MHSRGVTVLELIVVLAILGVVFGISGVAVASLKRPAESTRVADLRHARAAAIQSGAPRTARGALFLPDGRAIGPGADPLTGAPLAK